MRQFHNKAHQVERGVVVSSGEAVAELKKSLAEIKDIAQVE
jgi:hypothetical protein